MGLRSYPSVPAHLCLAPALLPSQAAYVVRLPPFFSLDESRVSLLLSP